VKQRSGIKERNFSEKKFFNVELLETVNISSCDILLIKVNSDFRIDLHRKFFE